MLLLPDCIFFDLDGTLLDSLPGIEYSVREAFAACHLPVPEGSLRALIGPPIRTILAHVGNIDDHVTLDRLEHAFRASYDGGGWSKTVCFPDAGRALESMRYEGRRLFVVSNKPRHISVKILSAEGILDLFETVLTRDSRSPVYSGKEEMITELLTKRSISSKDCLFVGDTAEDAEAAAACGVKFALMTHGSGSMADIDSAPVACRPDHFSQLLPLMGKEILRD